MFSHFHVAVGSLQHDPAPLDRMIHVHFSVQRIVLVSSLSVWDASPSLRQYQTICLEQLVEIVDCSLACEMFYDLGMPSDDWHLVPNHLKYSPARPLYFQ